MKEEIVLKEEISLRELMLVVWNGKKIIALTTIVMILISSVLNFLVFKPRYEVSTTVMVTNFGKEQESIKSLEAYAEQVKSIFTINKIINKLNLDQRVYSISAIKKSYDVAVVGNSNNLLKITVSGTDANVITKIANAITVELGSIIEVSTRLSLLIDLQKKLDDVEDSLKSSTFELKKAEEQLALTPEKLTTQKVLADEPYLQSVAADKVGSNKQLGSLQLTSEEVNPVYTGLKEKISTMNISISKLTAEKQNYIDKIDLNNKKVEEIQKTTNSNEVAPDSLINSVNFFNAVVITPALEPDMPAGPNKIVNLALSVIIGGILGTLFVVFREYWVKSAKT